MEARLLGTTNKKTSERRANLARRRKRRRLLNQTWLQEQNGRSWSRLCKNAFPPPKTARNRGRSVLTRRSEHIFALSSPESTRAQARATLSDLNGHAMRLTARALHARIATRSGLMATMFITRVRL